MFVRVTTERFDLAYVKVAGTGDVDRSQITKAHAAVSMELVLH